MDIRKRVGLRIKQLRQNLKLKQEALAYKAEIDKTYINEVENGKRNVSVINLEKIVNALDVQVRDFFNHDLFSGGVQA